MLLILEQAGIYGSDNTLEEKKLGRTTVVLIKKMTQYTDTLC